jgi:hypothetical protein
MRKFAKSLLPGIDTPGGISINVLVQPMLPQRDKKVRFDVDYTGGTYTESNGKAELVYNVSSVYW